jgi:hypothetical protein
MWTQANISSFDLATVEQNKNDDPKVQHVIDSLLLTTWIL